MGNAGQFELQQLAESVGLQDIWLMMHEGKDGFTFDTIANPMGSIHGKDGVQTRCDVAMMLNSSEWQVACMRLCGNQPLKDMRTQSGHAVFPSDHFAICVSLI